MKKRTFASILRKYAPSFGCSCAYLYRNGVGFNWTESYKGKSVDFQAWHAVPIGWGDDRINRLVIHNASILLLGIPSAVEAYEKNDTEAGAALGIHGVKSICFRYNNGAWLTFDLFSFRSSDVVPQGIGAWDDGFLHSSEGAADYVPTYQDLIAA